MLGLENMPLLYQWYKGTTTNLPYFLFYMFKNEMNLPEN